MSTSSHEHGHHLRDDLHMSHDVHLKRALGVSGLTMFGLAYLVPLTVFTTYGIVTEETGGRVAFSYVFTLAAMLFTAMSYGQMVRAFPVSGSAYTYTSRSFGAHLGFLAGWALLLDYILLPMVNYAVIGLFINAQWPGIPIWVGYIVALALVTILNVIGITTIDKANNIIIAIQTVFVLVFVVLAIKTIMGGDVNFGLPFQGDAGPNGSGLGPVLAGAAILCLSFLGFDAVSTMAEEATEPRRDIPRAIMAVTVGGGVLFIILSWLAQVAHPATTFEVADSGATDVMNTIGGNAMAVFFTAAYVAGAFGSALTSQASVTRILYAMGRDGTLPRPLGTLAEQWRTPGAGHRFGVAGVAGRPVGRPRVVVLHRQLRCPHGLLGGQPVGGQALLVRPRGGPQRRHPPAAAPHRLRPDRLAVDLPLPQRPPHKVRRLARQDAPNVGLRG